MKGDLEIGGHFHECCEWDPLRPSSGGDVFDEAEVALNVRAALHAQVDCSHGYGDQCDVDWDGGSHGERTR